MIIPDKVHASQKEWQESISKSDKSKLFPTKSQNNENAEEWSKDKSREGYWESHQDKFSKSCLSRYQYSDLCCATQNMLIKTKKISAEIHQTQQVLSISKVFYMKIGNRCHQFLQYFIHEIKHDINSSVVWLCFFNT